MIVGIMFQRLAESFISPRFLESFSVPAAKGEEGLYLGFSHLHSFLASLGCRASRGYSDCVRLARGAHAVSKDESSGSAGSGAAAALVERLAP